MSLTAQLALGVLAFMCLASAILWRITNDFDKEFGPDLKKAEKHKPR